MNFDKNLNCLGSNNKFEGPWDDVPKFLNPNYGPKDFQNATGSMPVGDRCFQYLEEANKRATINNLTKKDLDNLDQFI